MFHKSSVPIYLAIFALNNPGDPRHGEEGRGGGGQRKPFEDVSDGVLIQIRFTFTEPVPNAECSQNASHFPPPYTLGIGIILLTVRRS